MESSAAIRSAIADLPAGLQTPVSRWFERLSDMHATPPDEATLPNLTRFVACSEYGANTLLRFWPELCEHLLEFDAPVEIEPLEQFVADMAGSTMSSDEIKSALREQRNLRLLHILWREVAGLAQVEETLSALSETADQLLRVATSFAQSQMLERFGNVRGVAGLPVSMVSLGMGKLGGRELNFSSDIDIIFSYSADGKSDGKKCLHAQEYFDRLSRQVVQLIDETTADGFVFRADTRLRPFGDSGPPVVSFAALESYLLQHGRDWERYAYVKASVVGVRPPAPIASELFNKLICPFVYRRYIDYGVFESLREMHSMISAEVRRRDLVNNIKLGPGGIREIEFIVQSFQLVRGGSRLELKNPSLLYVLPLLVDGRGIDATAAQALADSYRFLRRLENFIQALRDKQTHELPNDSIDRNRLCLAMGFADWGRLIETLDTHRTVVTQQFEEVAFRGESRNVNDSLRRRMSELWEGRATADLWQQALDEAGFSEATQIATIVVSFQGATATRKIDATARGRLQDFIPRLLLLAKDKDKPATTLERSLSVIEKVLRRSAYLALLNENKLAAERLVGLCERSAYIAGEIARFPVLLDELLDPGLVAGPISKAELQAELAERLRGGDEHDSEARMEASVQFQRATMFRVAVADFNGALPIMKVSDSLTFLAEVVLEEALSTAWRDLVDKHGAPSHVIDGEKHATGFGIIAYGKLGGLELSYGSDLDIVFLHDSKAEAQATDGDKPLDNALFFSRLVRRLVHYLTTHTNSGILYDIDTRLRPSGRKGLLVTSTDAFERYQEENAWTWEHQALLRARPVAGSEMIGKEFDRIRKETLTHRVQLDTLRDDVLDMRARMREELDRGDAEHFDLKQGRGGIGDIEFLVQYLVLRKAGKHESLIEYTDNIRQLDGLVACGEIPQQDATDLQEIYRQYRLCQHHLVLNDERAIVAVRQFPQERERVARAWEDFFGS